MTVEGLKAFFDVLTVVLLGLTFLAGLVVLISGSIISRRQEDKLRMFDIDLMAAKSGLVIQQARAAEARAAQERVQIALAEQQEKTALAERALLELQRSLADRCLTAEQQKLIGTKLAQFAGQRYSMVPYWDSPESSGFANCINGALQLARWTYLPPPSTGIALFGGIVGVEVWRHPNADRNTVDAADQLVYALSTLNFRAVLKLESSTNNPKNDDISLSVGSRR